MQIELYSFSKRKNSTKKPTSSGTVVSCVFKEETSVMSPSFELSSGSPIGYNYVKAWTNYYYITDCTFVTNGTWRISCRLDSLATYETAIKGMSAFIEYTDTYDARIFDPRLAKKINATEISTTAASSYVDPIGYYALTVIGEDTCGVYALSLADVNNLMQNCTQWWNNYDTSSWITVEESIKNFGALFITGNPAENIKSCKFIAAASQGGSLKRIHAGFYDTGVFGASFSYGSRQVGTISISVPHPSNIMLRTSATCEYSLYLPFIGNISLSADVLADESSLSIDFGVHGATGDLAITVKTGSGKYIGSYGGNLGCDVPIGSSGIGVRTVATAVGAVAIGAATAGAGAMGVGLSESSGAAAASSITQGLTSAAAGISNIQGTSSCVGGLGSCASLALSTDIKLTCSYWDVSDSGSSLTGLIGNPYYKVDTIGNHGYVSCSGASIDAIAYDDITNEINAYLRSGIYVE